MAIGDIFKSSETQELRARVQELEALLTPEVLDYFSLQQKLAETKEEIARQNEKLKQFRDEFFMLGKRVQEARNQLIQVENEVLFQEFGLYTPTYDFATSDLYKERLEQVRKEQKSLIKLDRAATGSTNWTVDGSRQKGEKMVSDMKKLLLRAFNSECDELISKVKFNNIETAEKRMKSSRDAISKLGSLMSVSITQVYYNSKIDELRLAHEYQLKKQEEKEEQKRIREELREQAKLQKELEEARREIEKERKHYANALAKIEQQISTATDEQRELLMQKREEIQSQVTQLDKDMQNVDYRAANQKAGYVYVISNLGAFGENVYKIGMTRRLDPMDRVDELGDASVPFNFDVHAMIFTEDAPKLEAALHRAFDDKKLNMVNTRREFFNVTLEEVEAVVKQNYDKTVEFTRTPPAEQYRQSLLMRENIH